MSRSRPYGTQWKTITVLTVVWVLLSGRISLGIVVAGFLIGLGVTLVFPLPPVVFRGRLHPVGALVLMVRLVVDLVRSSFVVALLAFRRESPKNAMVRVGLRSDSDLYMALVSELVSLVPGTLVVEARQSTRTLYLHVLGVAHRADLDDARRTVLEAEARVLRAFGSGEEIAIIEEGRGR